MARCPILGPRVFGVAVEEGWVECRIPLPVARYGRPREPAVLEALDPGRAREADNGSGGERPRTPTPRREKLGPARRPWECRVCGYLNYPAKATCEGRDGFCMVRPPSLGGGAERPAPSPQRPSSPPRAPGRAPTAPAELPKDEPEGASGGRSAEFLEGAEGVALRGEDALCRRLMSDLPLQRGGQSDPASSSAVSPPYGVESSASIFFENEAALAFEGLWHNDGERFRIALEERTLHWKDGARTRLELCGSELYFFLGASEYRGSLVRGQQVSEDLIVWNNKYIWRRHALPPRRQEKGKGAVPANSRGGRARGSKQKETPPKNQRPHRAFIMLH